MEAKVQQQSKKATPETRVKGTPMTEMGDTLYGSEKGMTCLDICNSYFYTVSTILAHIENLADRKPSYENNKRVEDLIIECLTICNDGMEMLE